MFTVGAGTLIAVGTNTVGLATGAAYQFIGTGSDTVAEYINLSTLKGDGLTYATGVLTLGTPTQLTVISTDAVTTNSHTHSIQWSHTPGVNSRILGTDAAGLVTLVGATITTATLTTATVSGRLFLANGTAALPSLSFTSDTDTGIYRFGANSIGFAANGATPFALDDTFASFSVTLGGTYGQFANDVGANRFMIAFGSAALPGFTFIGDQDTGWYWENVNILGLSTGGVKRVTFSNTLTDFTTPIITPYLSAVSGISTNVIQEYNPLSSIQVYGHMVANDDLWVMGETQLWSDVDAYSNVTVGGVLYADTSVRTPLITATSGLTISTGTIITLDPFSAVILPDTKILQSASFATGFDGHGFYLAQDGLYYPGQSYLEVDNLTVRGLMNVYELVIQKIRSTNGNLFVTSSFKVVAVTGSGPTSSPPNPKAATTLLFTM